MRQKLGMILKVTSFKFVTAMHKSKNLLITVKI